MEGSIAPTYKKAEQIWTDGKKMEIALGAARRGC